ncbi:MAG TPA: DUF6577 family protein [Chitinophagaceae bacterium]|jgi:hypothetical protein|nr:DUF6577 family protein [Chitinophagaceae bacterium]
MKSQLKLEEIKSFLPVKEPFTRDIIRDFFIRKGEELTRENLMVRVNRLKSKGIIVNVGRGWYRLNNKKIFAPEITPSLKKVSGRLKKSFPFLNYALWSSIWLNDLATLQLFRNVFIIEVEAGSEEAVFMAIKESFPFKTFLNPDEFAWVNYMTSSDENIIIKTMISESPKENYHGIKIAKLEKILVDLYADKLWQSIFSSEVRNIYEEACNNYVLNFSTLLSYAARRGKRKEIWNYIKSLEVLDSPTIELIEQ